jgi:hypothetical protein
MKKNMGTVDRVLRTIIAIAIGVLWYTNRISGTLAIILGIAAVAFLITSFVSWCPAYMPLGMSTCKKPQGD